MMNNPADRLEALKSNLHEFTIKDLEHLSGLEKTPLTHLPPRLKEQLASQAHFSPRDCANGLVDQYKKRHEKYGTNIPSPTLLMAMVVDLANRIPEKRGDFSLVSNADILALGATFYSMGVEQMNRTLPTGRGKQVIRSFLIDDSRTESDPKNPASIAFQVQESAKLLEYLSVVLADEIAET